MKKKISIVVPILNENKNIKKLVQDIKRNIKTLIYEVIFVDDNSTDGSIETLRKIKHQNKEVDFIINNGPQDLTQSCFKGISKSKNDLIIIMDGDLQHDPKYIEKLYYKLNVNNNDIVIASRNFKKIKTSSFSMVRNVFSRFLILILKLISGKNYIDPMSGYFIFKKKIFVKNKKILYGKGYKILADFIYNIPNLKIAEIFINFKSRVNGKSKMNLKVLILLIIFMIKKIIRI
tara:strand:- start:112 stop:810 length:699 start_codon:yes stop_codon:yes gene_type:complete